MVFALELEYTKFFKAPIDPKIIFPNFIPPQSFYYFDETLIKIIIKKKRYIITFDSLIKALRKIDKNERKH